MILVLERISWIILNPSYVIWRDFGLRSQVKIWNTNIMMALTAGTTSDLDVDIVEKTIDVFCIIRENEYKIREN